LAGWSWSPLVDGPGTQKGRRVAPAAWWRSCGSWTLRRGLSQPPGPTVLVVDVGHTEARHGRPGAVRRHRAGKGRGRPGARDADDGCLLAHRRVAGPGAGPSGLVGPENKVTRR